MYTYFLNMTVLSWVNVHLKSVKFLFLLSIVFTQLLISLIVI